MGNKQGEDVVPLPIASIVPGLFQPRKEFDVAELKGLAESIGAHGVIQPIIVRPYSGGYQLVAGERRWRAAKMAGLSEVPALVRLMSDQEAALIALIENVQRKDLGFFEEGEAYGRLLSEFDMTQQELADKVGRSQASIANKLRLLRLPVEARNIISREMISERHARALLALPRSDLQMRVLQEVVSRNLNVRETERLIEKILSETADAKHRTRIKGVVRDVRIFMNAFRQAAAALVSSGIEAEIVEKDLEDSYEFIVRVPKRMPRRTDQRKAGGDAENE